MLGCFVFVFFHSDSNSRQLVGGETLPNHSQADKWTQVCGDCPFVWERNLGEEEDSGQRDLLSQM